MEFYKDGDEIVSKWDPSEHYQGFHDILHGGIQSTMMDEIASWVVFIMFDTAGMTYQLNVRFRKPVVISKGIVTVRASLVKQQKRLAEIVARLYDGEDMLRAGGVANYYLTPREKAVTELNYPGRGAFLNQ
jgi:acyl-coenzyme A thioesterase PaaI-like protein